MFYFLYNGIEYDELLFELKKKTKNAKKEMLYPVGYDDVSQICLIMEDEKIKLFSQKKALYFLNYPLVFKGTISKENNGVCIKGKFCCNTYYKSYIASNLLTLYIAAIEAGNAGRSFVTGFLISVIGTFLFWIVIRILYLILFKKESNNIISMLSTLTN